MSNQKKVHLLCIDPQRDFCDDPTTHPDTGALYVQGADQDMIRLAAMVDRLGGSLHDIHITLDSHQQFHIAHPLFWRDQNGQPPPPFTLISHQDVLDGVWSPIKPSLRDWVLLYTESLAKNSRYVLCIWPPHCIIGSEGHAIQKDFNDAINRWAVNEIGLISFVTKGSNCLTEHYSAVQADVPRDDDETTQLNEDVINAMAVADIILIAGEALDFCVANTIRDIAAKFGVDNVKKFILLEDACSCVNAPGLESLGPDFVAELTGQGMGISTTVDFLAA